MRIVFFTRLYYPHIGGVETHVQNVSRILLGLGHQVTVVTEKHDRSSSEHETISGIKVHRIPLDLTAKESSKKWVIWKWLLIHQDIWTQTDVLHIHDVFFWLLPFKLLNPGLKIFTTFHGWEGIYPIPLKFKLIRKISAKLSSRVVNVGDFISRWYGTQAFATIYGAISPSPNIITHGHGVLFLGRLDPDTGFERFIDLFHLLKPSKMLFSVAGDGPLSSLIPQGVKHLGFVRNPISLIGQHEYVYCTGYQGILQAMAHRRLVLATYSNPLKQDYLLSHPASRYMVISTSAAGLVNQLTALPPAQKRRQIASAYHWASAQTWTKTALVYTTMWKL